MAMLLPIPRIQWTDGNGMPLVGGSVMFATPNTGGTTLRPIYADEAETTPLINPVPLDSAGISFSGGSQVSIWGFGQYEAWVRDADGNLIYSALLDTGGSLEGGTIDGSVQINGDLSVVGSILDTQSLTTPLITGTDGNFGGTLTAGAVNAGTVNSSGNLLGAGLIVNGNFAITGSGNIDGTVNAGAVGTNYLSVTGSGADFNGTNIANVGEIAASVGDFSEILINGQPLTLPTVQAGVYGANSDDGPNYTITFPTAFASLQGVSISPAVGNDGSTPPSPPYITGASATGIGITFPGLQPVGAVYSVFWMAVGT